jgi:hypothetical protein
VDVDPRIREQLRPVDHHGHRQEVTEAQAPRRRDHLGRRCRGQPRYQVAQGHRRVDVVGGVPGAVGGGEAGDPASRGVVVDGGHRLAQGHGAAPGHDVVADRLPQSAGAEPGVDEAVDQGLDPGAVARAAVAVSSPSHPQPVAYRLAEGQAPDPLGSEVLC